MRPTSFSQNMMFHKAPRQWYYTYVKKIPVIQDLTYANGGNAIHKGLERYYKNSLSLEDTKEEFNKLWIGYKLDRTFLHVKEDLYWLMVVNAINLKLSFTSVELRIFYSDAVAFLDGVNTKTDDIVDWKSSTRTAENEEEYTMQLKFYSYMYLRRFDRLPKKATIHYLKYTGTKGELSIEPTVKDTIWAEDWHFEIRKKMENVIREDKVPECGEVCNYFCPYKNLCFSNEKTFKVTLNILGNYIFVDGKISPLLNKGLEKKFSYELKNAHFIKKAKPYIDTTVKFWKPERRMLPLGFYKGLVKTLTDYAEHKKLELAIDVKDKRMKADSTVKMPEKFLNGVVLRDYQLQAVDKFIREQIGILQIGTGGGKTEIAIEIIRRLGVKVLFLVDKIELLNQTKNRIEDSLGIEVGVIRAKEQNPKNITVATVQTISKNVKQYASYLRGLPFVIFDETHKVAARSYWKISQQLINTRYRLGISGTAYRDDGNDMMINGVAGYKIFDLSSKELIDNGWLVRPSITFIQNYMGAGEVDRAEYRCKTGLINETKDYPKYYDEFIKDNVSRNNTVKGIVDNNKGKKILILTKLVEHGQFLTEMLNAKHLYGGTNKKDRKKIMEEFVDGELNILISTISIWSEGLDCPALDVIINAGANKGDVKTIQMLGRVLRTLEGKEGARYYDFIDETKFFRLASYARRRALRKEGHDVKTIEVNEID